MTPDVWTTLTLCALVVTNWVTRTRIDTEIASAITRPRLSTRRVRRAATTLAIRISTIGIATSALSQRWSAVETSSQTRLSEMSTSSCTRRSPCRKSLACPIAVVEPVAIARLSSAA